MATINAADLGVPSRRLRTFLVATRHDYISLDGLPTRQRWNCGRWDPPALCPSTSAPWPQRSMAAALGWSAGERINTRGNRRTSGGNEFSADGLSWCLTEKARSWKRVSDGQRLTEAQAGLLAGFPGDFPWQGSRTKAFLQAADVVAPPVAAALLGTVLGIEWGDHVAEYMERIYQAPAPPSPLPPRRAVQEELFALAS
ncbi:DNA cytosine methyltransferase [Nocardiopsis halophila]|uniref:DNA cytosine methyltransferase n=1 Tax=Nocardiopsis halophila TaxID=141692 RepID=UPI001268CF5A|nr:DNA cytosine methyltransferase [Nocardiopsis halophila]